MAHAKGCRYCKGTHRKLGAYKRCARKYGPKQMWPAVSSRRKEA